MELTITAESSFAFSISILHEGEAKALWLEQRGGEWRLDGHWIASKRIEWPEALARALRIATGQSVNYRTHRSMMRMAQGNNP